MGERGHAMESPQLGEPARLGEIDTLRGVAALMVLLIHSSEIFANYTGSGGWVHTAAAWGQSGTSGVMLFFLISGFVIPSSLKERSDRGGEVRQFAIRRFFRLYPAYWLSVILAVGAVYLLWARPIELPRVLANLTMIQKLLGYEHIQGLYWTLQSELAFYLLCALFYRFGLLHRTWFLPAFAAILTCLFAASHAQRTGGWLPPAVLSHPQHEVLIALAFMFLGASLRTWHDGRLPPFGKLFVAALALAWFAFPLVLWLYRSRSGIAEPGIDLRHTLAIGLFVLFGLSLRATGRGTEWLGKISYSIYLLHAVVLYALARVVHSVPALQGWHLSLYVLAVVAFTLPVAAFVYRWVEHPSIELGRRWSGSAPRSSVLSASRGGAG